MRRKEIKEKSQELIRAVKHFERWRRRGGGRGCRIPEALWKEAAGIARVEGVWATARALHMNDERLRERVGSAQAGASNGGKGEKPSGFIDLGTAAGLGGGGKTVLELARRDGERLRIDVSDASRVDVVALARGLWSRRP